METKEDKTNKTEQNKNPTDYGITQAEFHSLLGKASKPIIKPESTQK
ncbi:hypothetical protein ES703_14112 [subsurface metagenome]